MVIGSPGKMFSTSEIGPITDKKCTLSLASTGSLLSLPSDFGEEAAVEQGQQEEGGGRGCLGLR